LRRVVGMSEFIIMSRVLGRYEKVQNPVERHDLGMAV
jgi:hypothetical protein